MGRVQILYAVLSEPHVPAHHKKYVCHCVFFPVPIILAIAINSIRGQKWKRSVQTAVYLPYFISTVVLVAILQILLSPSTGILSHALRAVGIVGEKANLLGDPSAFVPVYVISGIWQSAGWNSIIFIAALAAVDGQLYDASKVDGANRWQQVWHVELPAILPTIIILLIMNMGGILSVGFEKTFLMQNALNKSVSEVISTYVYNVGLKSSQFSFGSAVGLFNTSVNFIFLVIANQVSKRAADDSILQRFHAGKPGTGDSLSQGCQPVWLQPDF